MIVTILIVPNGANCRQQQRVEELVSVCSGQDLLRVITRACSIYKRSTLSQDNACKYIVIMKVDYK